jgi:hypothetical protein
MVRRCRILSHSWLMIFLLFFSFHSLHGVACCPRVAVTDRC